MNILRISILCLFALTFLISCKKTKPTVSDVVPISPSELTVSLVSNTQATLNWIDKSTNEAGFKVERKTGNGTFGVIATTTAEITTINDAGLTPNTTYTYRVYSFNNTGKSLSYTNEVTITTYTPPTVTTTAISEITGISGVSGGNITIDGGSPITARGIVWGTNPAPTISLTTKTTDGSGVGQFASKLAGLTKNTKYYVRAYATNAAGTAYGNELVFTSNTVDLNSGLVAYYLFNGNANDSSGNQNHGSVIAANLGTDRFNNENSSYVFNLPNSYIDLTMRNFQISGSSNRTVSMWINPNSLSYRNMNLFASGNPVFSQAFNIRINTFLSTKSSYRLGFMSYVDDYDPFYNSNGGTEIRNNNWYHIIVIYENQNIKLYVNGLLEGSVVKSINTQGNQNYIGKSNHVGSENNFEGRIDDVRIYNRAITQEEITYLSRN